MASFFSMGFEPSFSKKINCGTYFGIFFNKKIQKPLSLIWKQCSIPCGGRFSLGDSVPRPVLTLRIDYFEWKLSRKYSLINSFLFYFILFKLIMLNLNYLTLKKWKLLYSQEQPSCLWKTTRTLSKGFHIFQNLAKTFTQRCHLSFKNV